MMPPDPVPAWWYEPDDDDGPCTHCAEASDPIRYACAYGAEHCAKCHFAVADNGSCADWCGVNQDDDERAVSVRNEEAA